MGDWGTWFQGVVGNVANQYAAYKWSPDPNVIMAKEYAENGYYTPGTRAPEPQGAITVTSDILVLGGLAALFFFAMSGD